MATWDFGGYEIEFESEGMMQQARRVDAEMDGAISQMAGDLANAIIKGEPEPSGFGGAGEAGLVWMQVEEQIREVAEPEMEDHIEDFAFSFLSGGGVVGSIVSAISGGGGGDGGMFDW